MVERNRFGLSRTIPASTRQEVRQRCGFGCVVCGLAWYDYEHFDPDFKDAKQHSASGITLLCSQCNQKRARGRLSVDKVRYADQHPRCRSDGFASEVFDFHTDSLEVVFASNSFTDCKTFIQLNEFPVLTLLPPIAPQQPLRLSGRFADETGEITLVIDDNVFRAGADNWDVECVGQQIKIRNGPRRIVLALRTDPPHRLIVERLNMEFEGIRLVGDEKSLKVSLDGRNWTQFATGSIRGGAVGMDIRNR